MDASSPDQPAPSSHQLAIGTGLLLVVILILAAALRLTNFGESLWLDELHTAWCVNGEFNEVAARASQGNQPPLPYWLLWGWVQLVGSSEWSLRGPALLASLATILLAFLFVRRWTGFASGALLAALALAVEPYSVFYGGEARVYALVQLLAIAHVWLFIEILLAEQARRWQAVAWVLVGAMLFYVHYTAALLFVAEALVLLLVGCAQHTNLFQRKLVCCAHPTKNTVPITQLAIAFALLALLCLPALGPLRQIAARRENWALFIDRPHLSDLWYAIPIGEALACAVVLVAVQLLLGTKKIWSKPELTVGLVLLCWFVVPLGLAWLLTWFDVARLFHIRYYVVFLPAWACLLGWLVTLVPEKRQRWGVAVIVSVFLSANAFFAVPSSRQEDWRGAIAWLNAHSDAQAPPTILLAAGLIEADALRAADDPTLAAYCSFPLHSAYPLIPGAQVLPLPATSPGEITSEQAELLQHGAWLMLRGDQASSEQCLADVQKKLGAAAPDFQEVVRFDGLTIFRRWPVPGE